MLKAAIVSVVDYCTRYAYATIAVSLLIAGISVYYTGEHFAINTDITKLISKDVAWRQRELAFDRLFPDRSERFILAVVEAPTSELASLARAELADKLAADKMVFTSVTQPGGSAFFRQNGLLFLPTEDLAKLTKPLTRAALLIRSLVVDPSLRGVAGVVGFVLTGVGSGQTTLDQVAGGFDKAAVTIEDVLAGRPASFSWNELLSGKPTTPGDRRKFIRATPVLDFNALEPGKHATDAIRAAAASLDLASRYQARVRLTGPVPIENEEFGTVREGAALNGIVTVAVVLLILWMALRSLRIILAVVIALFIGLSATAALAAPDAVATAAVPAAAGADSASVLIWSEAAASFSLAATTFSTFAVSPVSSDFFAADSAAFCRTSLSLAAGAAFTSPAVVPESTVAAGGGAASVCLAITAVVASAFFSSFAVSLLAVVTVWARFFCASARRWAAASLSLSELAALASSVAFARSAAAVFCFSNCAISRFFRRTLSSATVISRSLARSSEYQPLASVSVSSFVIGSSRSSRSSSAI